MATCKVDRRAVLAALAATPLASIADAATERRTRVGVIGHTGRGNYGHGLDTVWLKMPEAELAAVADADAAGLEAAQKRLGVDAGFRDYREMLATVRPDVVAICPRHPDQHLEMTLAAIEAGARGIFMEKPFCRTPAEADEILAAAKRHSTKIALAHVNRYHPTLPVVAELIAQGGIGRLLEIRGRGKGDHRGGSEDLWVLGSHVMNLIHYFAGKPKSCSAVVKLKGRRIERGDIVEGNEALGPLAGDEVHARYEMSSGVVAYFDSLSGEGTGGAGFGLRIIGSEAAIDIDSGRHPLAYLLPGNPFEPGVKPSPAVAITSAGLGEPEPRKDLVEWVNHQLAPATDLLAAIREDRPPLCNEREGAITVEMICAVFESHRQESRAVPIPLERRDHPLERL